MKTRMKNWKLMKQKFIFLSQVNMLVICYDIPYNVCSGGLEHKSEFVGVSVFRVQRAPHAIGCERPPRDPWPFAACLPFLSLSPLSCRFFTESIKVEIGQKSEFVNTALETFKGY